MAKFTKAIKWSVEYSWWGFEPSNAGTTWQILEKTANGYQWADNLSFNPENSWTAWQVLIKTATGYQWVDVSSLWVVVKDSTSPIDVKKIWAWTESQYSNLSEYNTDTIYHTV